MLVLAIGAFVLYDGDSETNSGIGDLHIPNRVGDLPAKFKKLLVSVRLAGPAC